MSYLPRPQTWRQLICLQLETCLSHLFFCGEVILRACSRTLARCTGIAHCWLQRTPRGNKLDCALLGCRESVAERLTGTYPLLGQGMRAPRRAMPRPRRDAAYGQHWRSSPTAAKQNAKNDCDDQTRRTCASAMVCGRVLLRVRACLHRPV